MDQITNTLFEMRDEAYARFQQKLIPNVPPERVIGVRIPALRAYAKEIAGTKEAADFLLDLPHVYYDQNNLHGALIERIGSFDRALAAVEVFLPHIDNWATCDSFCPKVLRTDPDALWERIQAWLRNTHVYTVRYALVRMTMWYLDRDRFSTAVLDAAAAVRHSDYYVRMAIAWLFSVALVKQYDATLPYLLHARLDTWVHNKAIQKAIESDRMPKDRKNELRSLKRYQKT